MHLPMAASLAALSCAETDDAKPAMESTTGSVRRYAFVCFMVLLLDAFPSGMRDPALSKGLSRAVQIRNTRASARPAARAANVAPPRR
jgi:hypothetical protein